MKNIKVIRIPAWFRRLLGHLPKWKETDISGGQRIVKHAHAFLAVYFTFGVSFIETAAGIRRLPVAAIVIVPPGQVHGWVTEGETSSGFVGHFHRGHSAHATEPFNAPAV